MIFLEENGLNLLELNKFNSLFGMNNIRMQKKFGIDQNFLNEKYKDVLNDISKQRCY